MVSKKLPGTKSRKGGDETGKKGKVSGGGGARQTRRQAHRLLDPSDPETTERMLNNTLKRMGLYASKTVGDGNCMFRALSDQVWGNDNKHLGLRQEICDYMEAHPKSFEGFVDTERPFEHYLSVMRQRGTYGGHMELTAFARCKGRAVKVIMPEYVYIILPRDESPTPLEDASKNTLRALPHGTTAEELGGRSASAAASSSSAAPVQGAEEEGGGTGMVYVSYHIFEHYSSVRNLAGPHKGPPRIKETMAPTEEPTPHAESSVVDPAIEDSVKFVLRSLPHDHGVPEDDIRRRLQRGDPWETVVDDLVALLGVEDDEVEGSERSVSMVETKLGKDHSMSGRQAEGSSAPHLAYREVESAPSPTGSHVTATPAGSTDGRKIKPMGRPRLEGKSTRSRKVGGEGDANEDDDDGYETQRSSQDSFGASQGSRTGSTVSLGGGSDGSETTGSTCPLGATPGPSRSDVLPALSSPARPTHGRKRQLTSVSATDQSSRRITRSRNGTQAGSASTAHARRTFSVLGKNMAKVRDPAVVSTSAPGDTPAASTGQDDQVLRGKAKREARKRRAEIGRRERIEAEAWGLGGGLDDTEEGGGSTNEGRRTRGAAGAAAAAASGRREEGEGTIKGIKELYI